MLSHVSRNPSSRVDNRLFMSEKMWNEQFTQPLFKHVPPGNTAAPSTTEEVVTLQRCMKPLWFVMRLLGLFPVYHTTTGMADFKILSGAFKYSFVMFVMIGTYNIFVSHYRVSFMLVHNNEGINELIFSYMCFIYCLAFWSIPFGHWFGAKAVVQYINKWTLFQERFRQAIGVPIRFTIKQKVWFCSWAIPVFGALFVLFELSMLSIFSYWEFPYYYLITIYFEYHFGFWHFTCVTLSDAASSLKVSLTEELRARPNNTNVVPYYRQLWDDLSALTKSTGDVLCYVYGSVLIHSFAILTFSIYGTICGGDDRAKQVSLGFNSVFIFAYIFFICNSAHLATDNVGAGFLAFLKQFKSQDATVHHQLEEFHKAICLDPPCISLAGYTSVNRELFVSFMATIVTYLVVLLQFKAGEQTGVNSAIDRNVSQPVT